MSDLFDYLKIDKKEDIYTFCLQAFMDNSQDFRKASASTWGFDKKSEYEVFRGSVKLDLKTVNGRTKIIPDLILLNEEHIAIIESKMFASEGWGQTKDYQENSEMIKRTIGEYTGRDLSNADTQFFYFTLAGVSANTAGYTTVRWADYYYKTLNNTSFNDEYLSLIGKAVFNRAKDYLDFENTYKDKKYTELVSNTNNSWIGPYSLFSSGLLDTEWDLAIGDKDNEYKIRNGVVHGKGHATFRTDLTDNDAWGKCGNTEEDNIWLFTRIEWNSDSVDMFFNWEYWRVKNENGNYIWVDYISNSKLSEGLKDISLENREKCCNALVQEGFCKNGFSIPPKRANMLHMLKFSITVESKSIGKLIEEIKERLEHFFKAAHFISDRLELNGSSGYIEFNTDNTE